MSHCTECEMGRPCHAARVAGFFSCQVDRKSFYEQKIPLYPDKYNRWLVAIPTPPDGKLDVESLKGDVLMWLNNVGTQSGIDHSLMFGNFRAVKVLGVTTKKPTLEQLQRDRRIEKIVEPLPAFYASPLSDSPATQIVYVAIEFYYDGDATSGKWPWHARGFAIQCPEDLISGVVAVMKPYAALAPPTLMQELERPLQKAAIAVDEEVEPVLKAIAESRPAQHTLDAWQVLMYAGAGVLLFNLYRATAPTSRRGV